MSKRQKNMKALKFEQAIEQLEQIVEQVESGETGLEDCLVQYEQGMALITQCQEILGRAEKKIAELTLDENNQLAAKGVTRQEVNAHDGGDLQSQPSTQEEAL